MPKPKVEELQKLNWAACALNETLDELNGNLAETAKFLASIREACEAMPHPTDLEGLADVANRISGDLVEAKESLEAITSGDDGERLADLINRDGD